VPQVLLCFELWCFEKLQLETPQKNDGLGKAAKGMTLAI
jgi:hypothetical protein